VKTALKPACDRMGGVTCWGFIDKICEICDRARISGHGLLWPRIIAAAIAELTTTIGLACVASELMSKDGAALLQGPLTY